jgi:hypothetical protein
MRRPARRLAVRLTLAAALSLYVLTPQTAQAANPDCGAGGATEPHYVNGFTKSLDSTYLSWGVSADITVRSTNLCTSITDYTNIVWAWTMITAHNLNGWAQTGTLRRYGARTHHWWQWTACNGCFLHEGIHYQDLTDGEVHQYWTGYIGSGCPNSNSCLALRTDTTTWNKTDFDPNGTWPGPWLTQYFGETVYYGSDVPGRPTGKQNFNDMKSQSSPTTWESQRCGMVVIDHIPERWTQETYGCPSRATWTYNP